MISKSQEGNSEWETLWIKRTLWILGTKNTELHVQLLNICIQYSTYKKLSPTLWTVEGTAVHFLISQEDWDETVTEK